MRFTTATLGIIFTLSLTPIASRAEDQTNTQFNQDDQKQEEKPLSAAELREKLARGRLEKKIESVFRRTKLTLKGGRPNIEDYFVVARFQMPLATREAQLRFEVSQGMEESTKKVADYLITTPSSQVRDFRVVTRFKTPEEAQQGLAYVRKQYDDYQEYQSRMLQYMKQASSMRRC